MKKALLFCFLSLIPLISGARSINDFNAEVNQLWQEKDMKKMNAYFDEVKMKYVKGEVAASFVCLTMILREQVDVGDARSVPFFVEGSWGYFPSRCRMLELLFRKSQETGDYTLVHEVAETLVGEFEVGKEQFLKVCPTQLEADKLSRAIQSRVFYIWGFSSAKIEKEGRFKIKTALSLKERVFMELKIGTTHAPTNTVTTHAPTNTGTSDANSKK